MPSVDHSQIESKTAQRFLDFGALVLAHESVVDVDGIDLIRFQGFVQQRRADGRVNATAHQQKHFVVADDTLDLLDAANLSSLHREARDDARNAFQKIPHHCLAFHGEIDALRMELHSVETLKFGTREKIKTAGRLLDYENNT